MARTNGFDADAVQGLSLSQSFGRLGFPKELDLPLPGEDRPAAVLPPGAVPPSAPPTPAGAVRGGASGAASVAAAMRSLGPPPSLPLPNSILPHAATTPAAAAVAILPPSMPPAASPVMRSIPAAHAAPPPPSPAGVSGGPPGIVGGNANPDRWVTLASFQQPNAAHIARIQLKAAGVPCIFCDRAHMEIAWLPAHAGGEIYLRVAPDHAARAREILGRLAENLAPKAPTPPPVMGVSNPLIVGIVAIAHFPDAETAHLSATLLAAGGVAAGLAESLGRHGRLTAGREAARHAGPITLCVSIEEVDKAVALLSQTPAARQYLLNANTTMASLNRPDVVVEPCPKCGNTLAVRGGRVWQVVAGVLALAWLPFVPGYHLAGLGAFALLSLGWALTLLATRPLRCPTCKHEWKPAKDRHVADADVG